MSDDEEFGHNPGNVYGNVTGSDLGTFDKAVQSVESGEADGMGFALSRHDEFLVFEATGIARNADGSMDAPAVVEKLLDVLGPTYAEYDDAGTNHLRAIYTDEGRISLPDGTVEKTIRDGERVYAVRLYDRGWTPVTGKHFSDTPEDCNSVTQDGIKRVLAALSASSNDE